MIEPENILNRSSTIQTDKIVQDLKNNHPLDRYVWRILQDKTWQRQQKVVDLVQVATHIPASMVGDRQAQKYLSVLVKSHILDAYLKKHSESAALILCALLRSNNLAALEQLYTEVLPLNKHDSRGHFPLYHVCRMGDIAATRLFLSLNPDLNLQTTTEQSTTLMMVCWNKKTEIARLLIARGANLELRDKTGNTAVHYAAEAGILQDLGLTVEDSHLFEIRNNLGHTPLHAAAIGNGFSTIPFLVSQKVNVESRDNEQNTPLLLACDAGSQEAIQILLDLKANVHVINKHDLSAYQLALDHFTPDNPLLKRLESLDAGMTDELRQRKALAHLFGIGSDNTKPSSSVSELQLPRNHIKINLEGMHLIFAEDLFQKLIFSYYTTYFPSEQTWSTFCQQLQESLGIDTQDEAFVAMEAVNPERASAALREAFAILRQTKLWDSFVIKNPQEEYKNVMSQINQGAAQAFLLGWTGHLVGCLLTRDCIYRCNRGNYNPDTPGILLDRIRNSQEIARSLPKLLNLTPDYFNEGIQEDLDLDSLEFLEQEIQKVGNCTIANANSLELAILWYVFEKAFDRDTGELIAQLIHKARTTHSRLLTLYLYLEKHKDPTKEAFPPDEQLLERIYNKRQRETAPAEATARRTMIQAWKRERRQ